MLSGTRAVITGGSRGVGLALSHSLSKMGCSITMLSRDEARLAERLRDLTKRPGQEHKYIAYDLADLVQNSIPREDALKEAFAESNFLVNCAGLANYRMLSKLSNQDIMSTINVNLTAPIILSKLAMMPMIRNSKNSNFKPAILNIASMLSSTGISISGTAPYSASKAGLLGFTEALANELKGKLRVNAVLPALIPETDMGKAASKSLPAVSMSEVVKMCEKVILDESMTGKFVAADGKGFRTIN